MIWIDLCFVSSTNVGILPYSKRFPGQYKMQSEDLPDILHFVLFTLHFAFLSSCRFARVMPSCFNVWHFAFFPCR